LRDSLIRSVTSDGELSVRCLVATSLVQEAARRHATRPTASAALGRTLMGALLLAASAKDDETLQIQLRGDGELGQVTAIADGEARVRGYVHNPDAHPPPRNGKLDVGTAVGKGLLAVVRYRPSWREPYSGLVPLVSGEIAEDLAAYLADSEQTPSVVALGVFVGATGEIEAAGGYLVQALPLASDEVMARLDETIQALPSPTSLLRSGIGAGGLLDLLVGDLGHRAVLEVEPRFHCGCNRDRIDRAVTLIGRDEAREIALQGEPLEVRCEFCATVYRLPADEVGALFPDA